VGYELWTSPITGYRRRGTRLAELRALLASGITAHAILEPLRWCPADAPSADIQSALRQKGFDVAGVLQDERGLLLARRTKGRVTFRRSLLQPSGSPRMTLRRRANASRYVILLNRTPPRPKH
jgi:hypothetical protein